MEGSRIEITYLDGEESRFDITLPVGEVRDHLSDVLSNAAYETPAFLHFSTKDEEAYIKVEQAALIRVTPTPLVDTDAPEEVAGTTVKTTRRKSTKSKADPA